MRILRVTPIMAELVETDEEDSPIYRRNRDGHWENLVGESWDSAYFPEELEAAYQEYKG